MKTPNAHQINRGVELAFRAGHLELSQRETQQYLRKLRNRKAAKRARKARRKNQ